MVIIQKAGKGINYVAVINKVEFGCQLFQHASKYYILLIRGLNSKTVSP